MQLRITGSKNLWKESENVTFVAETKEVPLRTTKQLMAKLVLKGGQWWPDHCGVRWASLFY
eukprot:scaffold4469_cov190-Cylindrotheca_fusiformis.AAC.1